MIQIPQILPNIISNNNNNSKSSSNGSNNSFCLLNKNNSKTLNKNSKESVKNLPKKRKSKQKFSITPSEIVNGCFGDIPKDSIFGDVKQNEKMLDKVTFGLKDINTAIELLNKKKAHYLNVKSILENEISKQSTEIDNIKDTTNPKTIHEINNINSREETKLKLSRQNNKSK